MSDNNNQTSFSKGSDGSEFPVAAIVCLSVGGYVVLVILFLIIRCILVSKGSLQSDFCCPENDICCCECGQINAPWLSCCCGTNSKGCCASLCATQKRINCRNLLCCSCGCPDGCSDKTNCRNLRCICCCQGSCSSLTPNLFCDCTHSSKGCCSGEPCCPFCFENDLDPNSCGCLCLEIKLRTSNHSTIKNSTSISPREAKSQHRASHEQTDTTVISHHEKVYQYPERLNNSSTNNSLDKLQVGNGSIQELRHSLIIPTMATSVYHPKPSNRSNNATITDFNSSDSSNKHSHPYGKKSTHINIQGTFEDPFNSSDSLRYLPYPTSSSSGDSQNVSSKSLLDKSTNTDSSIDTSHRSTSRSRKPLRPGQISQRFPNKILVSSESLKMSLEASKYVPEVSFIQSSDKSVPDLSSRFVALNSKRPLPSIKKT